MADMKGQLEFDVEAGGASATIGALKRDLASLGRAAKDAGESSAQGMKQAADAGNSAASKLDAATSSMVSRIKRSMAELSNGMKGSLDADLAERLGATRGLNAEALKPWIDALRQAETGARSAARAQQLIDAANQQSLAAERELAKLRNQSQQQAGQDFLTSQRTAQAQATQRAIEAQRDLVRALDAVNQAQRQGADAQTTSIVNEALVQAKQRSAAANAALADIGNGYRKTAEDLAKLDAEATARGERAARALAGLRAAADKAAKDAFYAPQRERDTAAADAATRAQQAQDAATKQLLASERELSGLRSQSQQQAAQDFLSAHRTAQAQATKRLTDAQQELQRAIEAVNQAERSGASTASASGRVTAAQQQVAAATSQLAALQQSTSAGASQIKSRDAFISGLEREAAAIGKTRTELLALQAAEMGVAAQAAPMLQKLREAEAGMGKAGVSAAQTAAALRNVPAQFTDIVTQLAGGANPLLVLTQQGGQLKDMFGGIGPAARALGGYIVGLINPVTVLGAALVGLGVAYQKGASESAAFARSITLTSNAAGITEGQFNQMAEAVSEASNTTIGSARATTQALVGMGQLSGGTLQRAAVATQLLAKVTGESADTIAKRFSDAKEAPAKFAAELNKQYNLLTAAQVREIRELENQGRAQEALNKTFDALNERLGKAADNFSLVERWWNTLKVAASKPINFIINYGRAPTAEGALADAEKALAELNGPTPFKNAPLKDAVQYTLRGDKFLQERRRDAEALVQSLRDSAKLGQDVAAAESRGVENQRARSAWDEVRQRNLSNEEKKVRELAEAEAKATAAKRDASDVDRRQIDKDLAAERKKIDEKYKEAKGSSAPANDANRAEVEAIRQAEQIKLELIKQSQSQIRLQRETGQITELQQIEETTRLELRALETRRDSLLKQADAVGKKENSRGESAAKRREAALIDEQINTRRIEGENALTIAIEKREQAWLQATGNENADFAQRAFDEAKSLREQADAQQLANDSIRLGAVDIAKLEAAKMLDTAASKERIAAQWEEQGVNLELAKTYNEQAAALRDLARAKVAGAVAQNDFGLESKARQELDAFLDPSKAEAFGDALRDAFGSAGNALRGLVDVFDDFGRKQAEIGKQRKNLDLISDPTERLEKEARLNEEANQSQIQSYANLAGAAKGFFDEGSKGYKALQAAEAAFQLYTIGSNLVKGISAAAVGIANQAQGDPYTAVPRMAAMAAVMASLGFVVAGAFGGSSGSAPPTNKGTGTVFGDAEAQSESIANAIELLTDVDTRTMRYSAQMLDALRNIESSLAGVTNLVLRNGALTTGQNFNIAQGTLSVNKGDPILNMLGLGGDTFASKLPVIGGVIGKLQSLWGKTTQEITGAGLFINGLLQDLAAGGGVQQYADVKTTSSSFFGLSKDTNYSSVFAPVSADIASQFGAIFSSFEDAVTSAGAPLGVSLDEISRRINGFVLDLGRIDLKGLTGEEIQERLSSVLGAAGDRIAIAALPGLESFQRVGEGYLETVVRVATSVETVAETLDMLGKTALRVGQDGTAAAMALVDAFGGLDELTKQTSSYYENYYSEAERAATTTRQLTEALADLGITTLPGSKDAFRDLVDAQDLTTESGRKTYAALIGLSDVFSDLKEAVESAGKGVREEIDRLRGTSSGGDEASVAAKFAIKTAQARAGDSDALAELPELSRALEEARAASASSAADLAFIRASLAASLSDTLKALNIPGFATGGEHMGGWRVVGEQGPELEYTPRSHIFSNQQSQSLVNNDKVEALLTQLIERFDAATDQGLRVDTALIIHAKKVADTLQSVVNGGQSLATRAGT